MNIHRLLFSVAFCLLSTIFALAQPGSLDSTFGNGGKVVGDSTVLAADVYQKRFNDIAIQADGKIVVAGNVENLNQKFAVFRYNPNGTPDAAFGTNGKVVIDIYPGYASMAGAVAIQPDGKIIAGGNTLKPNGSLVDQTDFAVMRFNPDGSRDLSFGSGNGGIVHNFSTLDYVKDIVLQPDGKILLTGDGLSRMGSMIYKGTSIFAMRFQPNGSPDTAFGTNGVAALSFETSPNPPILGSQVPESLALQPDGKIVVVGTVNVIGFGGGVIARFLPDGQPDTSFDADGKVYVTGVTDITSVVLQSDGRILVAGSSGSDFAVFRYTTAGAPDTSFDSDGRLVASIEAGVDYARDVLVQRNGKILVIGESSDGTNKNFALARFNANGSFDTSFDGDGKAVTDFGGATADSISRAALQQDGKIVVVGISGTGSGSTATYNIALARYIGDTPVTPFDFDGDGRADISVFRPSNGFWYRLNSSNNTFFAVQFGQTGDKAAPADYDGDGRTDIAVFREGEFGYFYILNSSDNTFRFAQFGKIGDTPTVGDWDGDGRADLAVYRGDNTTGAQSRFYYRPSAQSGVDFLTVINGTGGRPVIGDFDGDGRIDPTLFLPSAVWEIRRSSDNQVTQTTFGVQSDIPVAADFDGDGRANIAVFRPSNGTWYTSQNAATNYGAIVFGASGDLPVAADYDGDGRTDAAVFRPSNGTWYLQRSTAGFTGIAFGQAGDKPVPNSFVP